MGGTDDTVSPSLWVFHLESYITDLSYDLPFHFAKNTTLDCESPP
jgi:hypothetical protein